MTQSPKDKQEEIRPDGYIFPGAVEHMRKHAKKGLGDNWPVFIQPVRGYEEINLIPTEVLREIVGVLNNAKNNTICLYAVAKSEEFKQQLMDEGARIDSLLTKLCNEEAQADKPKEGD